MAGISIGSVSISVVPAATGFTDKLRSTLLPEADALGAEIGRHIADGINAALHDISVTVTAHADTAEASAALDELGRKAVSPTVTLDDSRIVTALEEISAKLDELGQGITDVRLTLEDGDIGARLDEISAKLDEIGDRDVTAKLSLDDSGFNRQLDEDMAKLDAAGSQSSGGGGLGGGLLTGGILGGLAASPAVPGALTGVASSVGVLGLAYENISPALQAYSAATTAAATASAKMGTTTASTAHAVTVAQAAVTAAATQQAHDQITSAETIANAQQGVTAAETAAANSQISAEQQLASAQYSEQQAQIALTDARQQAILTLQQLNNSSADAVLNAQQAQLSLEQAQLTQQQVNASATSTALQKQQADLNVALAEQHLKESLEARTNTAAAAQKADKAGVAGSQAVLTAEHNLAQAHQAVGNAQRNLTTVQVTGAASVAKAEQALSDARRNAAWQQQADALRVAAAQAAVTYAAKGGAGAYNSAATAAAAYAAQMSNLDSAGQQMVKTLGPLLYGKTGLLNQLEGAAGDAILPGFKTFIDGIKSIAPMITTEVGKMGGILSQGMTAMGKTMQSSGFQAELKTLFDEGNQFMKILGPAIGQMVTAFLDAGAKSAPAVRGLADGLAAIAKGFGSMFTALAPFAPAIGSVLATLGQAVGAIGGPLGTVLGDLMKLLAPILAAALPLFKSLLDDIAKAVTPLVDELLPPLRDVLKAIGPLLGELVKGAGGLAVELVKGAKPLFDLVGTLANDLAPILPGLVGLVVQLANDGMSVLAGAVKELAPPLTKLVNDAFKALAPILPPIEATIEQLAGTLAKDFLSAVQQIAPYLGSIVGSFAQMLVALLPLLPPLTNLAVQVLPLALKYFTELLPALVPLLGALADLAKVLVPVVTWVAQFITVVLEVIAAVKKWITNIGDWKNAFGTAWKWVVSNVFDPMKTFFLTTIPGWWDAAIGFLSSKFVAPFENAFKGAWNWVMQNVLNPMDTFFTKTVPSWFDTAVSAIGTAWGKLGQVLAAPVNWVIDNVLNPLINAFDTVTNALGLGKPIPKIPDLGGGGGTGGGGGASSPAPSAGGAGPVPHAQQGMRIPGYGGGDQHLILTEAGETILPKEATSDPMTAAVARKYGVPGFATGGISPGGILGTIAGAAAKSLEQLVPGLGAVGAALSAAQASGLLDKFANMGADGAGGVLGKIITAIPKTIVSDMETWLSGHSSGGSGGGTGGAGTGGGKPGPVTAGVARWASDILKVLKMLGLPASDLGLVEIQMQSESGGNEAAINLWDSNAAAGHPSKGLMQVIQGTFDEWRNPSLSSNIYDPMANIYAAINYAIHGKGIGTGPGQLGSGHGYDSGGWLPPGLTLTMNGTGKPEPVLTGSQWDLISSAVAGGDGGALPGRHMARKLDRMIALLEQAPGRTAGGLGEALNGTARGAVQSAYFRTR